jgi:cytochrome c oxidase assembly factor CtaG
MPSLVQTALESWTIPVPLTFALVLAALLYLRGWLHLRSGSVNVIPGWHAGSFLLGLFLIWVAVGAPFAAFDEQLLTVHILQHVLLMTIAPGLILLGAPVTPLLHGFPRQFVPTVLGPLFRWSPAQRVGRVLSQPAFCWFAAAAALAGFLFWWPVVQPGPSVPSGRNGRSCFTCFWLQFRAASFLGSLPFATVLFTRRISPHHGRSAWPLSKTSSARAR